MSVTAVRTPAEFEAELQRYLFERAEEGRAVRVGEKEVSERAEIVARYRELFTREQLDALHEAESGASPDERERLYRLRKTCESGLVEVELSAREDELENAILAARVTYRGQELPLRSAQAQLAVLHDFQEREELGELHGDASAGQRPAMEMLQARESSTPSSRARRTPWRGTRRRRASRFASSRRY
jgi:hypothetical protein